MCGVVGLARATCTSRARIRALRVEKGESKGGEVGRRARCDAEDAGDEEGDLGGELVEKSVSFRSQDTSDGDRDGKGGRMLERWV